MRRPASLLSVEKNCGRGKRRARSECKFFLIFNKQGNKKTEKYTNEQTKINRQIYKQANKPTKNKQKNRKICKQTNKK